MAEVADLNSVEHITASVKNIDFEWIRRTGCSLHHQLVSSVLNLETEVCFRIMRFVMQDLSVPCTVTSKTYCA
jgi:hypothetical protein